MATVLLVNLPRQEAERAPAVIAGLAGICKSVNVDYEVADINLETIKSATTEQWRQFQDYVGYFSDECADDIIEAFKQLVPHVLPKQHFDVIAVSLFTYETIRAAHMVLPIIRQTYPNSKIVIGGHGTDFLDSDHDKRPFYQYALEHNMIDDYILGEAEEAFSEYIQDPGAWVNTAHKHQIKDLNTIPYACFDKIPPTKYLHSNIISTYITGSRGCVRNCTFCDVKYIWDKFRFRSAEHIFEEILLHHLEYGSQHIEFTDNLVNGSLSEFKKLNELLVNAQSKYPSLKKLEYRGDFICRPSNQFTEEDFALMAQAGGKDLLVGIESFSEDVRYHMRKKFSNEDIDFHLYCSGKYGVKNTFLMQIGYPTETQKDHEINLKYLERYQKYALTKVIKLIRWGYTTGILPGSPLDVEFRHKLKLQSPMHTSENVYGDTNWTTPLNPTNTYPERIRRRVELHFASNKLRYNQPRIHDEMLGVLKILKGSLNV